MVSVAESARAIAAWPEVAPLVEEVSQACTRLRFHEGLRRRIPEAAAESRVRGAHASADLDGARSTVDVVRDLMRGAATWPDDGDPGMAVLRGAVQATAESERAASGLLRAPRQALARLHLAAAAPLFDGADLDVVGRPRRLGETCAEFGDLGPAPDDVEPRLAGIVDLVSAEQAPALVVAALVHAEIASARPFVRGNGLVARALERALLQARGVDPTGVSVPELGHRGAGPVAYLGALAAYSTGSREGLVTWLRHHGEAMLRGAKEGERVADAVRAGRLT